jgi:hypothetical protein
MDNPFQIKGWKDNQATPAVNGGIHDMDLGKDVVQGKETECAVPLGRASSTIWVNSILVKVLERVTATAPALSTPK